MNRYLKEACESLDASVFSGEVFYDNESRNELKEYIARWQRAIASQEAKIDKLPGMRGQADLPGGEADAKSVGGPWGW